MHRSWMQLWTGGLAGQQGVAALRTCIPRRARGPYVPRARGHPLRLSDRQSRPADGGIHGVPDRSSTVKFRRAARIRDQPDTKRVEVIARSLGNTFRYLSITHPMASVRFAASGGESAQGNLDESSSKPSQVDC
jgi:hypothetical protein